jgi:PASTA domain-containing protein
MLDEPRRSRYGGTVAAQVFREVALGAAHILGITPDDTDAFREGVEMARLREVMEAGDATDGGSLLAARPESERITPPTPATAPIPGDGLIALTPVLVDADGPPMPDLSGLTMLEAWTQVEEMGLQARLLGSGVLVAQEPAPGSGVATGSAVRLVFAHPSEARAAGAATD